MKGELYVFKELKYEDGENLSLGWFLNTATYFFPWIIEVMFLKSSKIDQPCE
jgi:hypothetical protein